MNAELVSRPRCLAALLAATLALVLAGPLPAAARADGIDGAANLRVGHTIKQIEVPGSYQTGCPTAPSILCNRKVDVHLWYPADERGLSSDPRPSTTRRCGTNRSQRRGCRFPGRSRRRSRARVRRSIHLAEPFRDRVLARVEQRSDRLRAHARRDRRCRLRGSRALSRQQHPRRRPNRLHQRPGPHDPVPVQ